MQIIFGYHNRTLRLCGASNHLQENQKTSMKVDRNLIILTFWSLWKKKTCAGRNLPKCVKNQHECRQKLGLRKLLWFFLPDFYEKNHVAKQMLTLKVIVTWLLNLMKILLELTVIWDRLFHKLKRWQRFTFFWKRSQTWSKGKVCQLEKFRQTKKSNSPIPFLLHSAIILKFSWKFCTVFEINEKVFGNILFQIGTVHCTENEVFR